MMKDASSPEELETAGMISKLWSLVSSAISWAFQYIE